MGRERLFQLLIALGAALGLAALGLARAGTGALAQGTRSTPMASVVVARTDLAAGTVLSPALVAVRRLPAPDVPPGAFAAPSQVSGAVAKEAVFAGEPLVAGMLYPSLAASALPDQLPQGMRALDLAVSSVSGVGGLLVPGDRVDLVATLPSPRGGTEATLLVQDVPILMTVGGSGTASPFGRPARPRPWSWPKPRAP
jgi:pilus assembly protein CpaB